MANWLSNIISNIPFCIQIGNNYLQILAQSFICLMKLFFTSTHCEFQIMNEKRWQIISSKP